MFVGSISESNKGESKLVCNPCMELKETSAGTSSKKRRGCALGFGSKNKREEGPSEKTTSAETSSKKIRGITWPRNL